MSAADREVLFRHAQAIGNASRNTSRRSPERLAALLADAAAAGYEVREDSRRTFVEKARQYRRKRVVYSGVVIYHDEIGFNSAFRSDVRSDLALTIRSIDQVRRLLKLPVS